MLFSSTTKKESTNHLGTARTSRPDLLLFWLRFLSWIPPPPLPVLGPLSMIYLPRLRTRFSLVREGTATDKPPSPSPPLEDVGRADSIIVVAYKHIFRLV